MSRSNLQIKEAKARALIGVAGRKRDPEMIWVTRRDHAAVKLEIIITETLAKSGPLTAEQSAVLAALFTPAEAAAR